MQTDCLLKQNTKQGKNVHDNLSLPTLFLIEPEGSKPKLERGRVFNSEASAFVKSSRFAQGKDKGLKAMSARWNLCSIYLEILPRALLNLEFRWPQQILKQRFSYNELSSKTRQEFCRSTQLYPPSRSHPTLQKWITEMSIIKAKFTTFFNTDLWPRRFPKWSL